jgi:hypothetical protein
MSEEIGECRRRWRDVLPDVYILESDFSRNDFYLSRTGSAAYHTVLGWKTEIEFMMNPTQEVHARDSEGRLRLQPRFDQSLYLYMRFGLQLQCLSRWVLGVGARESPFNVSWPCVMPFYEIRVIGVDRSEQIRNRGAGDRVELTT